MLEGAQEVGKQTSRADKSKKTFKNSLDLLSLRSLVLLVHSFEGGVEMKAADSVDGG